MPAGSARSSRGSDGKAEAAPGSGVKLPASPHFLAQAAHYRLRFACEHCARFQASTDSCAHGFPTAEHRLDRLDQVGGAAQVVFCKDFELD